MVKDMTEGKPGRLILEFAIPLLLGNLFQQFYSLVDTAIVGKFLGVDQLAAVGSTGSINFLIIGFCMGICSGFAIPIAQRFGAKDESGMRRCVANSAWVSVIFAVVLTIVTVLLCRNILQWMRTPENIIDDAWMYIVIIFAGIPVTILYNLTSAIIRAMGDSKTPVYFLVMSALLNIVLDLFCILVLKMGVAGAALATVISQAISGICCLVYMIRKYEILRMQGTEGKADPELMLRLAGMGVPMGLQYSVTAIGSVILQSAVNTLGSTAVAAVTASGRISGFFVCPSDALGAKKPKRIREGLRMANIYGIVYALIAFGILAAAGKYMALLFVDGTDPELMNRIQQMLLINSGSYTFLILVNTLAIFSGVSEMIARSIAGFVLVPMFGFLGACVANPLAWLFADLFLIPAYLYVMRRVEDFFAGKREQL